MDLGDACDIEASLTWDERVQAIYKHVCEQDWGKPVASTHGEYQNLLAELMHWGLHLEKVREDTQAQLNQYEAAALKEQIGRGKQDAEA